MRNAVVADDFAIASQNDLEAALTAMVNASLTQHTSVHDLASEATDIVPTDDETAEILMRLEREHTPEQIERKVSRWFESI